MMRITRTVCLLRAPKKKHFFLVCQVELNDELGGKTAEKNGQTTSPGFLPPPKILVGLSALSFRIFPIKLL